MGIITKIADKIADRIVAKLTDGMIMRRIADAVDFAQERLPARDPVYLLNLDAAQEAKEFINANLTHATCYWNTMYPWFWDHMINGISPTLVDCGGLCIEFGVFKGESINHFARRRPELTFHGFDSFEGLPKEWAGMMAPKGTFDVGGALPPVEPNVVLYKGWFDRTLPEFMKENEGKKIAFLHIDCDIYSSTKTIFEFAGNAITDGTIIVFDDWHGFPNWREQSHKAWKEFCAGYDISYRFIAFCGWKAAVVVDSIKHKGRVASHDEDDGVDTSIFVKIHENL
jgi:hypothetical protein